MGTVKKIKISDKNVLRYYLHPFAPPPFWGRGQISSSGYASGQTFANYLHCNFERFSLPLAFGTLSSYGWGVKIQSVVLKESDG